MRTVVRPNSDLSEVSAPLLELASIVNRFTSAEGRHDTAIAGLTFHRRSIRSRHVHAAHEPALTLVVQGLKRLVVGSTVYEFGEGHWLLTALDVPFVSQYPTATPAKPFLGLILRFHPEAIGALMADTAVPREPDGEAGDDEISVRAAMPCLLDPVLRLARLLDRPQDIPVLAPLYEREVLYRLLTGEQGARLKRLAVAGGRSHQIARAIGRLRENYVRLLRIDDLARAAGMSHSSFHRHFREVTSLSPLQYQKRLRLEEARRLMLIETLDVASACHQVGYQSASQFSRDYRRVYGASPTQDMLDLRRS